MIKKTPSPKEMTESDIDENVIESFPASDPPSWTLGIDPDRQKRNHPRKRKEKSARTPIKNLSSQGP
jgi:hypothetical protein